MLLNSDIFSSFTWTYLVHQKSDITLFFLAVFGRGTRDRNPLSSRTGTFG